MKKSKRSKRRKKGYSLLSILVTCIVIGGILIISGSFFMNILKNTLEKNYNEMIDKIISNSKKYTSDNEEFLDKYFAANLIEFDLPLDSLIDDKYMIAKTDEDGNAGVINPKTKKVINGYVKITKDNNYHYDFIESTKENISLYKKILNDNNITNSDNGLYINEYNKKDLGDLKYVFKGNNLNNYITINSVSYRIIGITNSYNLKAIRSEYNTNINSYGTGENINFFKSKSGIKTVNKLNYLNDINNQKYFSLGVFNVGFIPYDLNSVEDVLKNEKRNIAITEVLPQYTGYAAFINVSDLLNSSINSECMMQDITKCDGYLFDLIENGLVTNNTTSFNEDNSVLKLTKSGLSTITDLKMGSNKEVVYIKGSLEYLNGDGSENNPYIY